MDATAIALVAALGAPVGWRTDGTGKYLAAAPPLEWSAEKNVVWRTEMKARSNATPVLVGDKIFVCKEIDTLVCLSATDGKILWEKANPIEVALTDEQVAELRQMKKEYAEVQDKLKPLHAERGELDKKVNVARKGWHAAQREHGKARNEENKAKKALAKAKKEDAGIAEAEEALKAAQQKVGLAAADVKAAKEDPALKEAEAEYKAKRDALNKNKIGPLEGRRNQLRKYHRPGTHGDNGYSSATPVSDGKSVYAVFGTGVVVCYDLAGQRKWARYLGKPRSGHGLCASPLLTGDKLVVQVGSTIALDKKTGDTLWTSKAAEKFGTPVLAKVGDVPVVITADASFVRLSDGEVLAKAPTGLTYNAPVLHKGVAYFIQHGGKAVEVPPAAGEGEDKIEPKVLWTTKPKSDRYYGSPLFHDELIYAATQGGHLSVIDANDGKIVYEKPLKIGGDLYASVTMAGKYIFLTAGAGQTVIIEPGREYKEVARNSLGDAYWSCPVFQGTRMYVRTRKYMYCIGK